MPDLSTPNKAREHARAMAGTVIANMPTIPARAAGNPPAGVAAESVVWEEALGAGEYAGRVLKRGTRVRLTNMEGDGCVQMLIINADHPAERLNIADTVKVQWNAYLGKGKLLLSDMGRVLMSIMEDTCQRHDTICGGSNAKVNARKYGEGENYSKCPNARDRFLIALQKFGLGKKDIPPVLNLFKAVRIEPDGATTFVQDSSRPGDYVELRAEMNVIVVLVNSPHVLDPRATYAATPVRITAWRGAPGGKDDAIRNSTPEAVRAFENVEDYFNV
ncbi:MAG TPA: urea amidolyase associated protein UAAP1 [Phycisphaerae bacterium]|jgi:urea carboxylase-associated protein 2|nr:urea amidolyase associated protein UAAP1 [Phycisphaerae bacterium]